MDTRKKLVELLKTNACPSPFICDQACKYYGYGDCFPDRFADYLIANGVTVQEWISAKDRLPENDDIVMVIASGKVGNITLVNALELGTYSIDEGWILEMWPEWEDPKVTYWMPLPQPPEGE